MERFADRVAIVTGPSDRGIGGAIAEKFAEEGGAICLVGLEKPERLIKRFDRKGYRYFWYEADITDQEQVDQTIQACMNQFQKIDVLVNNAGVEFSKPFEDITDLDWQRLIDVNLTGAMRMARACLPSLTQPGGVIVNIASSLGMAGCAGFPAYSASKAGLIGMTQSLALELGPSGRRIVCVAPALVITPMAHQHLDQLTEQGRKLIESSHPLGVGMPQDVADAVAFLASDEARWITGISLPLGWVNTMNLPITDMVLNEKPSTE